MSDENDDQLDQLLSDHLHRRLDPQLGRAAAGFETDVPLPRRPRLPIVAAVGGVIAAAILIAAPLLLQNHPTNRPVDVVIKPTTLAVAPARDDVNFNRLLMWRAVDEGARVVDDTLPVRKVRYEAVEQIEWEDPDDQATIQLSVPVAEVVLVQQPTF